MLRVVFFGLYTVCISCCHGISFLLPTLHPQKPTRGQWETKGPFKFLGSKVMGMRWDCRHFEGVEGEYRKQICLSVYLKQYCCERKYTWLRTMKHGQSLLEGKWSETLVKRLIFHFHDCFKPSEIHEHFSWCFTLCRMVSRSLSFVKGTTQSFWSSSCNQPNAMRSQVRFFSPDSKKDLWTFRKSVS